MLNERGARVVERLLSVAVIPAPNLTEVLYLARRRGHRMSSDELLQSILRLGVDVEPFSEADVMRAAELVFVSRTDSSTRDSLSLADASCIAVAERLELPVTGSDRYWETLSLDITYQPFR